MKKIVLSQDDKQPRVLQSVRQITSLPLEKIAHLEQFEKGETIIAFNSQTEILYVLLEGTAKIYFIHEDGKRSIIHFVKPGEMIGELGLFGTENYTKDVIAQTSCICLAISLSTHKEALLNDVTFLQEMNKYLVEKLLNRTERFSEGLNYPLVNRLAAFILYTEHEGIYHEKHTEVAEYLSVSYRHLLYTFEQLQEAGYIKKEKPTYRIIDRQALESLAKDIHS